MDNNRERNGELRKRSSSKSKNYKSDKRTQTGNVSTRRQRNVADKRDRWDEVSENNVFKLKANDKAWYNRFPGQVRDFANFNFLTPVGSRTQYGVEWFDADRFPGIMALYFAPAAGDNKDGNASPLNMAANQLYQFVRFENNGSSLYDRGDLMLYMLAVDSLYMLYAYMRRIYGSITLFSDVNEYLPKAICRANRVDYESFEPHLRDFLGFINQFGYKLAQIPMPATMSYVARHMWMADNLWVDENTRKCQIYMFVPLYFYKFGYETEGPDAGAPFLDYVNPSYGELLTLDALMEFANQMIDPLVTNEDFNNIGSDILKAFGTNGLIRMEAIDPMYRVTPLYSEEVLDQIENACAMGHPACYKDLNGYSMNGGHAVFWRSSDNTLVPNSYTWAPFDTTQTWQFPGSSFGYNKLLNFVKDDITNDDIMVATRLTTTATSEFIEGAGTLLTLHGLGSELFCQYAMFFYTTEGAAGWRLGNTTMGYFARPIVSVLPNGDASSTAEDWVSAMNAAKVQDHIEKKATTRFIQCASMFRRHPQMYMFGAREFASYTAQGELLVSGVEFNSWPETWKRLGDTANYAFLDQHNLENLSKVALMSEFYVPLAASGPLQIK